MLTSIMVWNITIIFSIITETSEENVMIGFELVPLNDAFEPDWAP